MAENRRRGPKGASIDLLSVLTAMIVPYSEYTFACSSGSVPAHAFPCLHRRRCRRIHEVQTLASQGHPPPRLVCRASGPNCDASSAAQPRYRTSHPMSTFGRKALPPGRSSDSFVLHRAAHCARTGGRRSFGCPRPRCACSCSPEYARQELIFHSGPPRLGIQGSASSQRDHPRLMAHGPPRGGFFVSLP